MAEETVNSGEAEERKPFEAIITPEALPYLMIQQGRISNLEGMAWVKAYNGGLHANLAEIRPFFPEQVGGVLDIGGGMGGLCALINREYGGTLDVVIVDGDRDPAAVPKEKGLPFDGRTYSNCAAAYQFLQLNGVLHPKFLTAPPAGVEPRKEFEDAFLRTIEPVDLVLGVQAWGFHFPPSLHLALAFAFSKPGTVWILDVREREGNSPWAADLFSQERLEPIGRVPGHNGKYSRLAFRVIG